FLQGLLPGTGHAHIDLTLVARVDLASNERAFAVLQGANNPRHLRRQDTEQALNVPDNHGAVGMQNSQRQELNLLEVSRTLAAAQRRQTQLRYDFEEIPRGVLEADTCTGGNHVLHPSLALRLASGLFRLSTPSALSQFRTGMVSESA